MKRKMICLLLALVLLAGCTAAPQGGTSEATQGTTAAPTQGTTPPVETMAFEKVKNPATFLSISLTIGEQYLSMTAYPDENGMTFVDFVGEVKKVGTLDPTAIHGITKAVEESGLVALNGVNDYAEGAEFASAYVTYQDGSYLGLSYSGKVADSYKAAYEVLEDYFERLTAALPVYVPRPIVSGEVSEPELTAITEILDGSGMEMLDAFVIGPILKDESFAYSAGMSDSTHVLSGAYCGALMMTTPYSLVVVRVDDTRNIDAVREDLASNLAWNKWVCVSATNAVIAQKGDLVLCLMGSSLDYSATVQGIKNAGWENLQTYRAN